MSTPYLELAALKVVHMHDSLVYQARPISLAYWKLELGHRETQFPVSERNGQKTTNFILCIFKEWSGKYHIS